VSLTDEVVVLRPFTLADVDAHLTGEDVEQVKWLSGGTSTRESVTAWILRNQKFWADNGPVFNFAVRDARTNDLMGMVEANQDREDIDGLFEGDANISYGLYPKYRGQGYVARALVLFERFLREQGVRRGVIRVEPENLASVAVPRRLGYDERNPIIARDGTTLLMFIKDL
jgi:RimJ/RimL family protein N-acetyltransferase